MTIGPVQLLVVGFDHPNFQGEILAELQRLRDDDMVRVIDALAVYKAVGGEVTALKESQLGGEEAAEFGAVMGALVGLGAGVEADADLEIGAERMVEQSGASGAGSGGGRTGRDSRGVRGGAHPARTPVGHPVARLHRPRGRSSARVRVHQPPRPRGGRPGLRAGGRGAGRRRPRRDATAERQ